MIYKISMAGRRLGLADSEPKLRFFNMTFRTKNRVGQGEPALHDRHANSKSATQPVGKSSRKILTNGQRRAFVVPLTPKFVTQMFQNKSRHLSSKSLALAQKFDF